MLSDDAPAASAERDAGPADARAARRLDLEQARGILEAQLAHGVSYRAHAGVSSSALKRLGRRATQLRVADGTAGAARGALRDFAHIVAGAAVGVARHDRGATPGHSVRVLRRDVERALALTHNTHYARERAGEEADLPNEPVWRLVREAADQSAHAEGGAVEFEAEALHDIKRAAERFLAALFGAAARLAQHAGRATVQQGDVELAHEVRAMAHGH